MQVFSAELDRVVRRFAPAPQSPHGRLCSGEYGGLHAILLVGADYDGFSYLDPFFESAGQPFVIPNAELVQVFQSATVVA